MQRTHALALALSVALAVSAQAAPTDPVTVTDPPDIGEPFSPGVRLVADLEQDYVEEEFFISGIGTGCGIGFELVFVLPPLVWLRRRKARA